MPSKANKKSSSSTLNLPDTIYIADGDPEPFVNLEDMPLDDGDLVAIYKLDVVKTYRIVGSLT